MSSSVSSPSVGGLDSVSNGPGPAARLGRRITAAALAVYCLWAALLILQNPGLQYDEALLVLGSVHIRKSAEELRLPHDPDTWVRVAGRSLPLMTARYVGAIKEYLCLPLFGIFGPSAALLRIVSALLGLLGIWGLARLIGDQVSPIAGAAVASVLSINPAYVDLTVFDNGTVSIWMASMGLVCLALNRYLRRETAQAAFLFGVTLGFGVWARANFVWLIGSAVAAATIVLRRRILAAPATHWIAAAAGGLLGGAPFLAYQVVSGGGTWQTFDILGVHDSLSRRLAMRLALLADTVFSDGEHRAIWGGPALPVWQRWLFPLLILAACAVCLFASRKLRGSTAVFAKTIALCFLFLSGILFFSTMPVGEHHVIVLVPIAAVMAVLASLEMAGRRAGRVVLVATAAVYFVGAIYWQVAAVHGLWISGGVGQWSDGVFDLARHLEKNYPGRPIKILDWGLQNNLYVLSDARINSVEIYGGATEQKSRSNRPWIEEIREGGVFLLNGPSNRQFPEASEGFLRAVHEAHPRMRRFTILQRDDVPYAEVFDIPAQPSL